MTFDQGRRRYTLGIFFLLGSCCPSNHLLGQPTNLSHPRREATSLRLSSATGVPGGTVSLALSLAGSDTPPAGLQWTLNYPFSQLSVNSITAGPTATAAGETLRCSSHSAGAITCILAATSPPAESMMKPGVVVNIQLTLAANARTSPVALTNPRGVSVTGSALIILAIGGTVSVPAVSSSAGSLPSVDTDVASDRRAATPPRLAVSPLTEDLTLTRGTATARGHITVANAGDATVQFSARAASKQGDWLSIVGNGSGTATASAPASVRFIADSSGLAPGVYTGQITVESAKPISQTIVDVSLAVSDSTQSLSLSPSAMTFSAIVSGASPPAQSLTVITQGVGVLNWTAQAEAIPNPLAPSADWLGVSQPSGVSVGGQPGASVQVSVNPAGLRAGRYFGWVRVMTPNAPNSPQSVSVMLNVGTDPAVDIGFSTGGLIFAGPAGSATPHLQQISLFNPGDSAVPYSASVSTQSGLNWLTVQGNRLLLPGSNVVSIGAAFSALPPGVQTGSVAFNFESGTTATIQVTSIATSRSAISMGSIVARGATPISSACTGGRAGYLVPVFRQPLSNAVLASGLPRAVQVEVVDDCGNILEARNGGSVQVAFGDGGASINLQDIGGGVWEGTWIPANVSPVVAIQAIASETSPDLSSLPAEIETSVQAAAPAPTPQVATVLNAAAGIHIPSGVVSPGGYVSINGANLAGDGQPLAGSAPLPESLNDTQLFLGDRRLPLIYASPNQVNAIIPQNLIANVPYQLIVRQGATLSPPTSLLVAAYQPGIYTVDSSGEGQGIAEIAGTALLADAARPLKRGSEYLTIYATGLGPVVGSNGEAPPPDGAPTPLSTIYKTTANVSVIIGDVSVPASFSGLTPGFVALYQVNVPVPAGIAAGLAVPLYIEATDPATGARTLSNTVTIAVQ